VHLLLVGGNCGRGRGVEPSLAGPGSSLSSVGTTSLKCSVLECGQTYSTLCWSPLCNVFCSGSSSQRHDSKRTSAHAPKQCLPSARPKLSATNSKYEAIGGMRIVRGNRCARRKPAAVPLCPPQIPHDVAWDRTRDAAGYELPELWHGHIYPLTF
jgi:hypothetical protein